MGGQVLTPNDYQAMAEECFRRAREAKTDNECQDYLDLGSSVESTVRPVVPDVAVLLLEALRST
jgi:hypothetical protein